MPFFREFKLHKKNTQQWQQFGFSATGASILETVSSAEARHITSLHDRIRYYLFVGGDTNFPDAVIEELQIDSVGEFSTTSATIAQGMTLAIAALFVSTDASVSTDIVLTDACGGCGGNVMSFAANTSFKKIQAVEKNQHTFEMLQHNLETEAKEFERRKQPLAVTDIYRADYVEKMGDLEQDVVFVSPPWGGHDYHKVAKLKLMLDNVHLARIIEMINKLNQQDGRVKKTRYVCYMTPKNFDIEDMRNELCKWGAAFELEDDKGVRIIQSWKKMDLCCTKLF